MLICVNIVRDVILYRILMEQGLFAGEERLEGDWAPVAAYLMADQRKQ